jgi:hypothetical protein
MRRRLVWAFSILCTAAVLAACGDTGDHFGEFRQNPPSPTVVAKLGIVMPIIAGPYTKSGTFKLYVTAYDASDAAVQVGTALQNPIVINSNYTQGIKFGANKNTKLQFTAAPGPITVSYRAHFSPCTPPIAAITAFNHDAQPQNVVFDIVACGTPNPSSSPSTNPSTSPTSSPSPVPAVKRLVLSMPATPNPLSPGTFALVVTAYNSAGQPIATGTTFQNPIQLNSNSTCSVSFLSGGSGNASLTLATAPGSVNIAYSPPSATCTPPTNIVITAFDLDASPTTASFLILGGTSVVKGLSMNILAAPDQQSEGVYPLFIVAKGTNGKQIPFGTTLTNPIQLSSNSSCSLGFGITLNPGTFTPTFRMTSTQTQVYMQFDPANPACLPPKNGAPVTVQAIANGSPQVHTTISFPY